jgi:hypothetical protein
MKAQGVVVRGARWVVPVLGLVVLAGLSAVFAADSPLYVAVSTVLTLHPGTAPFIDIAHELAWWSVVTVLLAVLFDFVVAAPLWRRP